MLEPGNWGDTTRGVGRVGGADFHAGNNAVIILWEVALETARVLAAPESPSRLGCTFAMQTRVAAQTFRDRFRPGQRIYEVSCEDDVPVHLGNYDAITNPVHHGEPWLDYMPDEAISYWSDHHTGLTEVLIGGPVTVVREV